MSAYEKSILAEHPTDPRQRVYENLTGDQFLEHCARVKGGEIFITDIIQGRTPGLWTIRVRYTQPYKQQLDLI